MKGFLYFIIFAIAFSTSFAKTWENLCKGLPLGKRINHPDTCEKFIVCIGHGVEMDCPPHKTHFNKDLEVCDWPERAGCDGDGPNPGPSPDPTPSPGPSPNPWKKYCQGKPLGKHVKHPDTCEKYIVCIGYGQEMNCPPLLTHFNEELEVCDFPERAKCE